jgi:hypothetical protein
LSRFADPVFEDIEIYCSLKRSRPVVLSLRLDAASKGRLVTGFVVSCDCEVGCLKGVQCLLGKRITERKRKLQGKMH